MQVLHDIHFRHGPLIITKADLTSLDSLRAPGGYVGLRNGGSGQRRAWFPGQPTTWTGRKWNKDGPCLE